MTYKLLKWPYKLVMLVVAILLLPIPIIAGMAISSSFKEFCEAIDVWFEICLLDKQ